MDPGPAAHGGRRRGPPCPGRIDGKVKAGRNEARKWDCDGTDNAGGARAQGQVIRESQKQGLLSSMGRVQTGRVARPEKQENEEECDPCAGSSATSSCPHPKQGWGRPVPVTPRVDSQGYPSLSSEGLDLSSSQVIILEVRKVPICVYSPSTWGRSACGRVGGRGGEREPWCR